MTADDVSPAEVMSTCCLAVASGGYVVALTMVAREATDGFRSIDGFGRPVLVFSLLIVSGFSIWRLLDSCLAAAKPVSSIYHLSALLPPFAVCAMLAAPIWVHFEGMPSAPHHRRSERAAAQTRAAVFVAAAVVGGVLLGILLCIVWAGVTLLFDPDPEAVIGSSRLVSTAVLRMLFLTGCGVGVVAAIVGGRRLLRNPESG